VNNFTGCEQVVVSVNACADIGDNLVRDGNNLAPGVSILPLIVNPYSL
jgi:hypothetical protein